MHVLVVEMESFVNKNGKKQIYVKWAYDSPAFVEKAKFAFHGL